MEESAEIPEWFDDFEDYVKSLVEYREMLSSIIRLSAALLPEHALEVVFHEPNALSWLSHASYLS